MRYLLYCLLFAGRFLLFPVYYLCGFLPRSREQWVFGSWGGYRFADNAAAFFRFCNDQIGDEVKLTWISRDRSITRKLRENGYSAHWIWSPGGILACLRAEMHIYDCFAKDTNFWLSRGSTRVCLWSGVPLKVFERDIDNPRSRYYRLFHGLLPERWFLGVMMPWHLVRAELIIAPSSETADITQKAFAVPAERVVITGYPRNDAMINSSQAGIGPDSHLPDSFTEAVASDETVFLYLPTFRDSGASYMAIDWEKLDALLLRCNARFFFKTHPMDETRTPIDSHRIVELPQETDAYELLAHVDALISDYSSIIFDYMLLDRPILYYTPDLEDFVSGSRSLNFHPSEVAVGPMCANFDALCAALEHVALNQSADYSERRREIMPRLHQYTDAGSSERVLKVIRERL